MSDRLTGLAPVSAREQAQKHFPRAGIQPLPDPATPGRAAAADVGISDGSQISFYVAGDSGGIVNGEAQNSVSYAMQEALGPRPAFLYHLGDWVYYNGDADQWLPQFYEAYAHLPVPAVGIPGNHDGDTTDDPSRAPLDTWIANLCAKTPGPPPTDPELEFGRHTQTLPWCDWTLDLQALTLIGVYSNVPSGGHLEQSQLDWLTGELEAADTGKPLAVALHHPPVSVDAHHGGSQRMSDALDGCFEASKRCPDLVLSGHVHDYQRHTRSYWGRSVTYVVLGNSGYRNLHKLAADATPGMALGNGFTFGYGDDSEWGFLTLTVGDGTFTGSYTGVTPGLKPDGSDAAVTPSKDTFKIEVGT